MRGDGHVGGLPWTAKQMSIVLFAAKQFFLIVVSILWVDELLLNLCQKQIH